MPSPECQTLRGDWPPLCFIFRVSSELFTFLITWQLMHSLKLSLAHAKPDVHVPAPHMVVVHMGEEAFYLLQASILRLERPAANPVPTTDFSQGAFKIVGSLANLI